MPFLKAASENTLLLAIIEGFGRSFYRNAISSVLLERERYFSTKVCDLGLHFGAKSSCPSNAQIL